MKRALPALLDTLHALALAVWFGGWVAFALAFVPAAQRFYPGAQNGAAAPIILGEAARHISAFNEFCGVVMVGTQFLLRRRHRQDKNRFLQDSVRHLLTFAALLAAEYTRREAAPTDATLSSSILVQVALLGIVAGITVWLSTSAAAPAIFAPSATAPETPIRPAVKRNPGRTRR